MKILKIHNNSLASLLNDMHHIMASLSFFLPEPLNTVSSSQYGKTVSYVYPTPSGGCSPPKTDHSDVKGLKKCTYMNSQVRGEPYSLGKNNITALNTKQLASR